MLILSGLKVVHESFGGNEVLLNLSKMVVSAVSKVGYSRNQVRFAIRTAVAAFAQQDLADDLKLRRAAAAQLFKAGLVDRPVREMLGKRDALRGKVVMKFFLKKTITVVSI